MGICDVRSNHKISQKVIQRIKINIRINLEPRIILTKASLEFAAAVTELCRGTIDM